MADQYLLINLQRYNHLNGQEDNVVLDQLQSIGIQKVSLALSFGNQEFLYQSCMESVKQHPELHVEMIHQYPLMSHLQFQKQTKEQLQHQVHRDYRLFTEWTGNTPEVGFCGLQSDNPYYNQVLKEEGFRFGGDPEHLIDFKNNVKYRAPIIPLKLESLPHRLFRKSQFKVLQDSMQQFDYLRLALTTNSLLHLGIAKALEEFLEPVLKTRKILFYSELQNTLIPEESK